MNDGRRLLNDGWSDEDVERLTGLTLIQIIGLRADAAAAPLKPSRGVTATPPPKRHVQHPY